MKTVNEIVAQVWPGWQLESRVGAGAYGEVYRASREDVTGVSVSAIKVIKIQRQDLGSLFPNSASARDEFERVMARFGREIHLMQSLRGQTNIVSIEDYSILEDAEGGLWYILIRMELLTPLLVDLDIHGWDEEKLIRIGIDICHGLEVCENEHIAHRDIKPENILVNHHGDYKLGDFGVARTLDATRQAMTGWEFARWEPFLAPEVKNGQLREADFQEACSVDIYALGMLLYWIANGQRFPFLPEKQIYSSQDREAAEQRRLKGEALPGLPAVSPGLEQVIQKACAFDSRKRYHSAREFREALDALRNKGTAEVAQASNAPKPRRRWLPIAAVAAALAILAALWMLIPAQVSIQYIDADGGILATEEAYLRPGTIVLWTGNPELLPEGYTLTGDQMVQLSVDLLRHASDAVFTCAQSLEDVEYTTLEFKDIRYPHTYAIGQPFSFPGVTASADPLTSLKVTLYTETARWIEAVEIPADTKVFQMENLSCEIFDHLDEGLFWLELVATDAAGRITGFSHKCTASYLAEEHTLYDLNRAYAPPELRGAYVYGGHTYEIYRMPGGGWQAASAFAQGKGGHLVTFADEEEYTAVTSYCLGMNIKYLNIGAELTSGQWGWADGSPFLFHPWKPEEEDADPPYDPVGSIIYTASQQWLYGKATQYEMAHFIVEYDEYLH